MTHKDKPLNIPDRLTTTRIATLVAGLLLGGCAIQPQPFTKDELKSGLEHQRDALFADQSPIDAPVSMEEAMARALKYNLDHRLKIMEEALSQRQLDLARFDLLPRVAADAGYFWRSNEAASSSKDYFTGQQSLVPSTSSDPEHFTGDLKVSWNVLDFGVSYYTAQQQADRVLVMRERRRKVVHLMMQQVRQAYWQALGAQQLEGRIGPLLDQTRDALTDSRKIESEKLQAPLDTLNYQRQLLDILRQLEAVRAELMQAKPRLASIMNVAPGDDFKLAVPEGFAVPDLPVNPATMEEQALTQRPELIEAGYNERIGLLETKKALARVLPGINIEFGTNYDSDSYLVNQNWRDLGLRVSWNLMNLLNYKNIKGAADAQYDVAKQQHLALSMAVLTQVHVAWQDYQGSKRQFQLATDLNEVDQRILTHTQNAARASAQGKLAEIRAAASAMMSELRLYQNYGALQNAYGQMAASLGMDPLPESVAAHDIKTLAAAIALTEQRWETPQVAAR